MRGKRFWAKGIKVGAGIAVTALALWLSFRKLDLQAFKEAFIQVNIFWVVLALANVLFVTYALGWRWQILLKPEGKIPLSSLFRLNIISQYTNIIMPARLGEVVRVYLASRENRVSVGYVMGTVAVEKILDFLVFVVLWISVPAFFAIEKGIKGYMTVGFFCLLAAVLLVLFIWRPKTFLKGIRLVGQLLPRKWREGFQYFFEKGIEAFVLLKSAKTTAALVAFTLFFVGGQVLTIFFLFKAFCLNLSFWVGLVVLLVIKLGSIPPSAPGKIGIYEYAVILALSAFAVSKSQALSYGIMLHLVAYLPKILLGFIFLLQLKSGYQADELIK